MPYQSIEESRMAQRAELLADAVWDAVARWQPFEKNTVGQQMARAVDSIGANLAESSGRFHPNEVIHFLYYARGSLQESRYWLKRVAARKLVAGDQAHRWAAELDALHLELNAYIKFQRTRSVKEPAALYLTGPSDDEPAT